MGEEIAISHPNQSFGGGIVLPRVDTELDVNDSMSNKHQNVSIDLEEDLDINSGPSRMPKHQLSMTCSTTAREDSRSVVVPKPLLPEIEGNLGL